MSEARTGNLLTTAVFNPALLSKEDLVRGFVARQDLLKRFLDDLRRLQPGSLPQHQLVIGQRGLGKTTLLRRLAFAIEDDTKLSAAWMPLVFPEEQYNVKNLGDFWLNCADALSDALDRLGDDSAAEALDEKVRDVPTASEKRSAAALRLLVDEAIRLGKGLVLLVDNLDLVLDRLDEREEWEFRRVISAEPRLYFVGASSRAIEALYEHGRAFYDYFQVHDLKGLSDCETFAVLGHLADEARDDHVQTVVREKPGRVKALRVLTGGNPRTLMLLFRVLSQGPEGDVQRDMEQLLDLYTPVYKARFEEMASQAQHVVDVMAIHWDPLTAADLANKLAPLSVNQVSAQLKRLEDFGIVEKAPWFGEKKSAFQIAERFFNIWYLMRASRRVRRRLIWLMKFLETWFEREEINERARTYLQRDPTLVGPERFAEMALAYSQTVQDRHLRRNLESAGLQAALDVSLRGQFDFSDLAPEAQGRKERMERLRGLRAKIMELYLPVSKAEELWELLGGTPHLSLEEKSKVVSDLPTISATGVQDLFEKLRRAKDRLTHIYRQHSAEISWLYRALANGSITDVYDVDGALAVAAQRGCQWLPIIAIASRISPWCNPELMTPAEIEQADGALQVLGAEPAHRPEAAHLYGNLLRYRAKQFDRAEVAYRRSVELDPQFVYAWSALGSLLQDHLARYTESEQFYRKALELDPKDAYSWNGLGNLLQDYLGRYDDAEAAYKNAIAIVPDDAYPWNALGNLFQDFLGRYDEAEQSFRRAIELDPQSAYGWHGLGTLLHDHLARYDEAEQAYRRALALDDKSPHAWGNLARLLERRPDRQLEAIQAFFKAAEIDEKNPERLIEALRIARSAGIGVYLAEAIAAVSHLHALMPDEAKTKFVLLGLLTLARDWTRARPLLIELSASEVEQPDIWAVRAAVASGYIEGVIDVFEQTGADQRWRPMYEGLRGFQTGSKLYLRRVAPEIRTVAESIMDEIAAGLAAEIQAL